MENTITYVKENRNIETEELQGYQVDFGDGQIWHVFIGGNRYNEVLEWIAEGNTPEPAYTEEERQAYLDNKAIQQWKASRTEAVTNIKVTVDSMEFDGDEVSQTRMARAIVAMNDTDTTTWVLADNTHTSVTKAQLTQALKLAGEAQTALWIR